ILPAFADLRDDAVFRTVTDLGMFFLMLFAGIEMQPHKIAEYSGGAVAVAVGGMVLPLALGAGLGWLFLPHSELQAPQALFLGTALAITAVPATVRILIDLGQLESPVGQTIVSAAVFDDILSLVLLAWLTGMLGAAEPLGLLGFIWLGAKILLFFAITAVIGLYVFPWGGRFMHYLKEEELEISAMLIAAFAFAVLAELLALHFIVGAFVAGLYFGQRTIDLKSYERVRDKVSGMTFGFLAPIFFASVGLNLDLSAFSEIPGFLALLIGVAFLAKIAGAGTGAYAFGFSRRESVAVGIGMSPRGAVELVIADIALTAGLFEVSGIRSTLLANLYSAIVIMAIVTTVVSPILLQWAFDRRPRR
ncbi:MAG: cation:proton antiporter, partial [Geminicoccaceae bacterium]